MWCKYFYRYFSFSISSRLKPVALLMSSILTFSFSIFFAISVLPLVSPSAIPSFLPHLYPSSCAYSIEACSSLICLFTPIYSILLNCNKNRSSKLYIFRQTIFCCYILIFLTWGPAWDRLKIIGIYFLQMYQKNLKFGLQLGFQMLEELEDANQTHHFPHRHRKRTSRRMRTLYHSPRCLGQR